MISYKGKIQEVEQNSFDSMDSQQNKQTKHDLLRSFIDQMKKINSFHDTLTKNLLEDKT